jgi:hypothetical protein
MPFKGFFETNEKKNLDLFKRLLHESDEVYKDFDSYPSQNSALYVYQLKKNGEPLVFLTMEYNKSSKTSEYSVRLEDSKFSLTRKTFDMLELLINQKFDSDIPNDKKSFLELLESSDLITLKLEQLNYGVQRKKYTFYKNKKKIIELFGQFSKNGGQFSLKNFKRTDNYLELTKDQFLAYDAMIGQQDERDQQNNRPNKIFLEE